MVAGNRLGDIGHAVQEVAEAAGFSVVREYVGHAIGRAMHEEPEVPNYGEPGKGPKLRVGNVFAVEPMVNVGRPETVAARRRLERGHRRRRARRPTAEHTIAITDDGPEILTRRRLTGLQARARRSARARMLSQLTLPAPSWQHRAHDASIFPSGLVTPLRLRAASVPRSQPRL